MSAPLTHGQRVFRDELSKRTGLDRRVIGAWMLAEESGGAAQTRERASNHNWLNIGYFDSGPGGLTKGKEFSNPRSAAAASADFLKGKRYGPSSGIRHIIKTAGSDPNKQIAAIAGSGWASSGYEGGSTLRSLFGSYFKNESPGGGIVGKSASKPVSAKSQAVQLTNTAQPATGVDDRRRAIASAYLSKRNPNNPILSLLAPQGTTSTAPAQSAFQPASQPKTPKTTNAPSVPSASTGGVGAERAIAEAAKRIGVTEINGSNRSPRIDSWQRKYGMLGQAWCGIFVGLNLEKAGVRGIDARVASVSEIERMARAGTGGFASWHSAAHARPGDALVTRQGGHVGLVESVDRDGTIHTIEGNTGNGTVARRTHRPQDVYGAARPRYRR